jgi:hypothetical protein
MKKIALASILSLTVSAASALEVGVTGTHDSSGTDRNFGGITVGHNYRDLGLTVGFERSIVGNNDQNRWSLVGSYDLVAFGPVKVSPQIGFAYLDNQNSSSGYAGTVGVSASVPVTNSVSVSVSMDRQYGHDRVSQFDGNRAGLSIRYKF